ncbi:MAG: patatin-like phospholipase family protein, partial [Gammaproteobacteria bacterium]|nr:patatin-like phospholipase family protein [Gammaproteobacteria bacterium]
MGKRITLVLGSGSARGLAHIGVIRVLEEHGFEVSAITGSSMGALIGGIYAAG